MRNQAPLQLSAFAYDILCIMHVGLNLNIPKALYIFHNTHDVLLNAAFSSCTIRIETSLLGVFVVVLPSIVGLEVFEHRRSCLLSKAQPASDAQNQLALRRAG